MGQATGGPFDVVGALAFVFGAVVVVASLVSMALTLLAVAGLPL